MERPKVYCKDCKHSGATSTGDGVWVDRYKCHHPLNIGGNFFSKNDHRIQDADDKNADNYCRDFEAKK